jgi:bifunctional non-homologous end joining protein LigD
MTPYVPAVPRSRFITPSAPILRPEPPAGRDWLHEVKFDGWRAQIHVEGATATIYGKNGGDLTARFRSIARIAETLPFKSVVLDSEIVAPDASGRPDFYALMRGVRDGCCAYCFDVLVFNGVPMFNDPIEQRRALLRRVLKREATDTLRVSHAFKDADRVLAHCAQHSLEGIVSKRCGSRYVAGPNPDWIKVKTAAWREANKSRWELFARVRT